VGAVPIPKASSETHQREDLSIFDFSLTDKEMETINGLTRPDGRTANQDPDVYEEF
jgi:diketogulonate reductase-like aldo/keto reductase